MSDRTRYQKILYTRIEESETNLRKIILRDTAKQVKTRKKRDKTEISKKDGLYLTLPVTWGGGAFIIFFSTDYKLLQ
jgi:hypothetical protein